MNNFTSVQYRRLMLNYYWHISCLIRKIVMWIHNTLISEPIWTILKVNKFILFMVKLYCVDCLHFLDFIHGRISIIPKFMIYFYVLLYHLRQFTTDHWFNGLPHLKCISIYLGALKGSCSYITAHNAPKRRLLHSSFHRYLRRPLFTFTP